MVAKQPLAAVKIPLAGQDEPFVPCEPAQPVITEPSTQTVENERTGD